jgi:hypothetical protein
LLDLLTSEPTYSQREKEAKRETTTRPAAKRPFKFKDFNGNG